MSDILWLDFETRSLVSLPDKGLHNYATDSSTQILLAAYAFGDRAVKLWQPHLGPIPAELEDALHDPFVTVYAWNAAFERCITRYVLGVDKPIPEWRDPMCNARYLSLPGSLAEAGEILGIGEDAAKIKDGDRLIDLFCEPECIGGENTFWGVSEPSFRDWTTDPRDWKAFCDYCKRDVEAERAIWKKMRRFPLPESEWRTWFLDQKVNEIGWPVDRPTVEGARAIVYKELEPLNARLKELTELENPNSRDQMLGWLRGQGYLFDSLNKDFVARALGGDCNLTDVAKEVLDIRGQTSKSSVSKYTALADMTSADDRLRHQYTFYGAHTGRWAAHGVNVGNLSKPTKEVEKRLELAVELVQKMDYDGIVREFGKPLEVAASVQRSAFRAPKGMKFVVADLNAIENRGLGYLARCDAILKVFRDGMDPYLAFAVQMYGDSYETLLAEYEAGDKHKRTICKAPVLGGGYQLGPGKEVRDQETGLTYLTGLRGYAQKMGIELSQADADLSIKVLRESWKEVKWLWKDMENAAAFAIRNPGQTIGVGVPQTKREEEYFEKLGRIVQEPIVNFRCHSDKVLEMILPSGRSLHYIDPRVVEEEKEWDGRKYKQDCLYFKGKDQETKQWQEKDTFGGALVENGDQAICRDVLVHGLHLADEMGFQIVGSTYDEAITLCPVNGHLGLKDLCKCLTTPTTWAGDAFPLGAEGYESDIYKKG